MKMKKFLITFIGMIILLTTPCLANEISVSQDIKTTKVTVEANLGAEFKNKKLMLYCLSDGRLISEIPEATENAQKTDKIYAISYGETNEEGKYTFSDIIVNGDNAKYVFYVTVSGNSKVFKSEAKYIANLSSVNAFLEAISNASKEEILSTVNDEVANKTIGLNILLYENLNDEGREQAADKLKNRAFSDINKAVEEINRVSVKAGIENAWSANALDVLLYPDDYTSISDFKEIIKDENGMSEYKDNLAFKNLSNLKSDLRIGILNNALNIQNTDSLIDKIVISVINHDISSCDGYADVTKVIENYYKNGILSGLDFTKYNTSKYRNELNIELLTKAFNSVSELISYVEGYIDNAGVENNPPISPNRGGGGGGGGGNSTPIITPTLVGQQTVTTPKTEAYHNTEFSDMSGYEWALPAVKYLGEKGIISGKGNSNFDPSGLITREEFVKIIVLAFGIEISTSKTEFSDITSGAWYEKYIASAVKAGIVNGISDTEFGSGKNVTRQDVAVIASRAFGAPEQDGNTEFYDDSVISDYARPSVLWMCEQGYIGGYQDKSFKPSNFCTRAEAAKIIYEMIN